MNDFDEYIRQGELDKLSKSHSSFPRNPILAEACFKGSYWENVFYVISLL
jgi:hypothetical protein